MGNTLSPRCVNWPFRNYHHLKSSSLHSCVFPSFDLSAPTLLPTAPKTHGNGDQVSLVHCCVPSARIFVERMHRDGDWGRSRAQTWRTDSHRKKVLLGGRRVSSWEYKSIPLSSSSSPQLEGLSYPQLQFPVTPGEGVSLS